LGSITLVGPEYEPTNGSAMTAPTTSFSRHFYIKKSNKKINKKTEKKKKSIHEEVSYM